MQSPPVWFEVGAALPSPPPSPLKRRRLLRESEELEGEMTIERYLYRADPYRTSSFEDPWPLPLWLEHIEEDIKRGDITLKQLEGDITEILENLDFQLDKTHVQFLFATKPGYPGGEVPVPAVVINVEQGMLPRPTVWAEARDELRRLLNRKGFKDVEIEIYDTYHAFNPLLYPLLPNDPSIHAYEAKRDLIVEYLNHRLGESWTAMSIFGFSLRAGTIRPALVVFVAPDTIQDWHIIEEVLGTMMDKETCPSVEFVVGGPRPLQTKGISLGDIALSRGLNMGASIGEVGASGGGIMGGHVLLKRDGQTHQTMITCHHVVEPLSAPQDVIEMIGKYGYGNTSSPFSMEVQYPSKDDLEATVDECKELISTSNEDISQQRGREERYKTKGEELPQRLMSRREYLDEVHSTVNDKQKLLSSLPLKIGSVSYSSGRVISNKKTIIDWALIDTSSLGACEVYNRLPNANELNGWLETDFGHKAQNYNVSDKKPKYATRFSFVEKGGWYFKVGRRTGVTAGVCHGTEVDINRPNATSTYWDENGMPFLIKTITTRELVIMGRKPSKVHIPFSQPGDTGALVIDRAGDVAGVLYGEFTGWARPAGILTEFFGDGLVSSMDEVLESVRSKTGGELLLPPQKNSPAVHIQVN